MLSLPTKEGKWMSKRKILIVDDEPPIRGLLVNALSEPGKEVVEAGDGNRALELAAEHGFFDVVVTDLLMPGMDGIELARRLRKGRLARRFLFISGYARMDSIDHTLEEFEHAEFLNKPFSIIELLRVVNDLCDSPPEHVMEPIQRAAGV
jgi:two-component system, cell cycle response regulator CpdR